MQEAYENEPLWLIIWHKKWRTLDWLSTSLVSSILISEVYQITLSVYPLLLTQIWLQIGVSSVFLMGILNIGTWILLSLALGWAIYSLHLASLSINDFENDYQPLIDLWTIQNPISDELIKKIITQENFVSLAQCLSHEDVPDVVKTYLQNADNCEHISKVITLLQLVFGTDNNNDKTKKFFIELFNKPDAEGDQSERIQNICELALFLWDGKLADSEDFMRILEKNSDFNNFLPQLEFAQSDSDLLQILLETPSLMKFYAKSLELYPNQPEESMSTIKTLAPYIRGEYKGPVKQDIFVILFDKFRDNPDLWIPIWNRLHSHPNIDSMQNILENINLTMLNGEQIMDILKISQPIDEMVNLIPVFLRFQIPCSSLEKCTNLNLYYSSIDAYLKMTSQPNQEDVLNIQNNMLIIQQKYQKKPDQLNKIVDKILHPEKYRGVLSWLGSSTQTKSKNSEQISEDDLSPKL